jgi:hypothetical protein
MLLVLVGTRASARFGGDFSNVGAQGSSPRKIGAVGGNVGLVDGSVNWKPLSQMKQYRGWSSQLEDPNARRNAVGFSMNLVVRITPASDLVDDFLFLLLILILLLIEERRVSV